MFLTASVNTMAAPAEEIPVCSKTELLLRDGRQYIEFTLPPPKAELPVAAGYPVDEFRESGIELLRLLMQ